MGYPPRYDPPGSIHHVGHRGASQRSAFERLREIRRLLARLALAVRNGKILVLAYVFLNNHCHFVIVSVTGELSDVLRDAFAPYVRRFNLVRGRDGALFGRRFWSKRITSEHHRTCTLRYVNKNATDAGLLRDPALGPYASAAYLREGVRIPPWLRRSWEGQDIEWLRSLCKPPTPAERRFFEHRMQHPSREDCPLDDLIDATSEGLFAWLEARARVADQTRAGLPVVDPVTVDRICAAARASEREWFVNPSGRRRRDALVVARVALLRDLAGCTYAEIGRRLDRGAKGIRALCRDHVTCLDGDETYALRYAALARQCLDTCHPRPGR